MDNDSYKVTIINRLINVLKGQAMAINDDQNIPIEGKLEQMKVVGNMMKFIKDYDKNITILALDEIARQSSLQDEDER